MTRSVAILGTRGYPSYYGGFETAVRFIAPHLAEKGWDVTVYGRDGAVKSDDATRDQRVTSRLTRGVESKSLSTLSYGFTSVADTARRKPDVALVMNVANGFWLPLLRARGIPSVVNVDGIEWERAKWGRAAKAVFHGGARFTAKFGDHLVYDAKAIAARWKTEFNRDGHYIPYGGIDSLGAGREAEFPPGSYVLMVARFVPENTVLEFFEAVERLPESVPVVVVGTAGYGGALDERARELAERRESFHWLGHISDDARLHSLWENAGVYFHGHSVGGTNPALVQAMWCSAPTVARDTTFNREVLADSGVFVPPEPGAIAPALLAVLEGGQTRQSLRESTRARAERDFSWTDVCERYESVLEQAIGRHR